MVETRGQKRGASPTTAPTATTATAPSSSKEHITAGQDKKKAKVSGEQDTAKDNSVAQAKKPADKHDAKQDDQSSSTNGQKAGVLQQDKLDQVLQNLEHPRMQGQIDNDKDPPSRIVMAHILNAMLSSARVPHNVAASALEVLLDKSYHDLDVLAQTSWEQRTADLREGGYIRYDERISNFLGDLINFMSEKYDNDASKILPSEKKGVEARDKLSTNLKEIKGLGPTAVDIILGSIQDYFPQIAPFLSARSQETAEHIGLGNNVDAIFQAVGSRPATMARVEAALTQIRLEREESEFTG